MEFVVCIPLWLQGKRGAPTSSSYCAECRACFTHLHTVQLAVVVIVVFEGLVANVMSMALARDQSPQKT